MAKEKFLLVSLKESKAKKLAQVISNETCRKILDYLADKEATESELGKKLNIPISTVHYNLKCLMDGGLVNVEEFHYSEKGKEVNHYKLANKYIIIAPKSTYGIREKLKSILPVALLVGVTSAVIQIFQKGMMFGGVGIDASYESAAPVMRKAIADASMEAASEAATVATTGAPEAAPIMQEAARQTTNTGAEVISQALARQQAIEAAPNIALWFLIGAVSAIVIYMIVDYIRNRK